MKTLLPSLLLLLATGPAFAQASKAKTPPAKAPTAKKPAQTKAQRPDLEAHFIGLRVHGESILIRTPRTKKTILIDAGLPMAGPGIVRYLERIGVKKIDLLLLSHDDPDHIGGMVDVVRSLPVGEFWTSPRPNKGALHRQLLAELAQKKVPSRIVKRGTTHTFEPGVQLDVLAPHNPWLRTLGRITANPNSLVVRLTYGETRFLFTGDIYTKTEQRLLQEQADLRCHLLKVPHHGSTTSSSSRFLAATRAQAAVICCERGGTLGLPQKRVLDRLRRARMDWYRTDVNGTVVVKTRGVPAGELRVTFARGKKNDPRPGRISPLRVVSKYVSSFLRANRARQKTKLAKAKAKAAER